MTSRLSFSALLLGACSGAHLPPVPAPSSVPSSSSSSAHRPWVCSTPVGALELPLPEAQTCSLQLTLSSLYTDAAQLEGHLRSVCAVAEVLEFGRR